MTDFPQLPNHNYRQELNWYSDGKRGGASYTAASGQSISFILTSIKGSGGQNLDLANYPDSGNWAATAITKLPHKFSVSVRLLGPRYHQQRQQLLNLLGIPSDQQHPATLSLPGFGALAVAVASWRVNESPLNAGMAELEIQFIRLLITRKQPQREKFPRQAVETALANEAEKHISTVAQLENLDKQSSLLESLQAALSTLSTALAYATAAAQLPATVAAQIASQVSSIGDQLTTLIRSPQLLAQSLMGSAWQLSAALLRPAQALLGMFPAAKDAEDDSKALIQQHYSGVARQLLRPLLVNTIVRPSPSNTFPNQKASRQALLVFQRLSHTTLLAAASEILAVTPFASENQRQDMLSRYSQAQASINGGGPDLQAALQQLSQWLYQQQRFSLPQLSHQNIKQPLPLLTLATALRVAPAQLAFFNPVWDNFFIKGEVAYVAHSS